MSALNRAANRCVFLDRDGVINAAPWNADEGRWDSPYTLNDFRLLPGSAQAVRLINDAGFLAVVVSNQPGVAKGKCDLAFLSAIDQKMLLEIAQQGGRLDAIYYCLHHPQAQVEALREDCDCRKPKPGLLLRAAADLAIDLSRSYIVGDQWTDVEAGLNAGCRTVLLNSPRPISTELSASRGDGAYPRSLFDAVTTLLGGEV